MMLTAQNRQMCLSSNALIIEVFLSLEEQVYPKMLIFISVGFSAPEMFIFSYKTLIYPRKTIN